MASAFLRDQGPGLGASVIHPDISFGSIIVPDAHLLFSGHFSRSGPDLILTGPDGRHFIVPGYFATEHPPALMAPNGAALSADVIGLMAGSPTPGEYAQSQPTAPPDLIGKVEKLVGSATVIRNGVSVTLHVGDAVYKSDVIETGADSKLGIGFPDGTALELLANTRMALSEYSYDPNGHTNSALFTYVEGTFGFFAGKVAHTGDMKIATPIATMGIRGTTGVMGQGTDQNGHDFYWQSIYDDPGTRISGSWDDFGQSADGTTFVQVTVSQPGEMTVFTLQGPGLPPLITTIPLPDSYNLMALALVDDLSDIIRLLNAAPHSLGSPGSPENPLEVLPPENLPGIPGNGPQPIFYVPIQPPGSPPEIVPIILPSPTPGTQNGFIWPSGTGTWDTAFSWTGHEVPVSSGDTVTIESGVVQYGNNGADNYVIATLIVDAPAELDIVSGTLDVQNGLDDAGKIIVGGGDPPSFTVSGPVTIEAGGKLIARGGAVIDITVAEVSNCGTIAARHGGDVEFIDDTVTNAAASPGSAPGKIKSIGFGSVVDFTGADFDNGGVVLAKDGGGMFFVDSSVTNDASGRFTASHCGSITFSATPVDNSGVIRAIFGGFIKFEDLVTNETGGDIRSAGCDSCVVFCGNELDNSGAVAATFAGNIKFFGETIVNEAAGTTDDTTVPGGIIDAKDRGAIKVYGGSLTNGAGALVEAEQHGSIDITDAYVLNAGTFNAADCGLICIQGCDGSVINTGEMVARDSGAIVFDALSGVTNDDGGRIEAEDNGCVVFTDVSVTNYDQADGGPFNRTGAGVIAAIGCGSQVDLRDATIIGGTIETRDGGVIEVLSPAWDATNTVVFDGTGQTVMVDAFVQVQPGATLELRGAIDNQGVIDVDPQFGPGADLAIDGTVELHGSGAVTLEGPNDAITGVAHSGAVLENFSTIEGQGSIGGGGKALTLDNERSGVIDADVARKMLVLDTGCNTIGNAGKLESTSGGILAIRSNVDNTDGTIAASAEGIFSSPTMVKLFDVTIEGGTLLTDDPASSHGGMIEVTPGGVSEFDGSGQMVTIDGYVQVDAGANLALAGTIDNLGTIDVDGVAGADLLIDGTVNLKGEGDIVLDEFKDQILGGSHGSTLENFSNISGQGTIGNNLLTLVNESSGVIDADVKQKTLTIDTDHSVTNHGTLEASNGGTLLVDDVVTGGGKALIEGGVLHFAAAANIGDITFNNGAGETNYGEVIFDNPNGLDATVNNFAGTQGNLAHSDGIELAGIWTTESSLTGTGGTLVVVLHDGGETVTLSFADFSDDLHISTVGGDTLITDPPPADATQTASVSIGGPGGDHFVFAPGMGAESAPSLNTWSAFECDHFANAHTAHELRSLIMTDMHGPVVDPGHHDSVVLPGMAPAEFHAMLHGSVHLH